MFRISTLVRRSAAGIAAVVALPLVTGVADASQIVTCDFEKSTGVVRIDVKGIEAGVVLERSMDERLLVNADLCTASDDTVADLSNISKVVIRGGTSEQAVVIDFDGGPFTPGRGDEAGGSDEIEFDIALGEGSDYLQIQAYDAGTSVRAGTKDGKHLLNLNPDEASGVDADVKVAAVERVAFSGAMSDDEFRGTGGRGTGLPFRVALTLEDYVGGNDTLVGGAAGDGLYDQAGNDTDVLRGGAGWDYLSSYDQDVAADVVDGQGGTDTCYYDAGDSSSSCEDFPDN